MSTERSSTIGQQRRTNYALQARDEEDFIHLLTDSLPPRPEYFGRDVELNRQGASSIDELPAPKPLSAAEAKRLQAEGAILLDTRPSNDFAAAHVPGSLHIALSGQYASWPHASSASTATSSSSAKTPTSSVNPSSARPRRYRARRRLPRRRHHRLEPGWLRARLHPPDHRA
ncbi:MAG: rhodanese-like domain-containing protein [Edaphobacter sp.]